MVANKTILWSAEQIDLPQEAWSRLEGLGYKILVPDQGQEDGAQLTKNNPEVWVKELNGGFESFVELLPEYQAQNPEMQVVLISLQPNSDEAVQAIRAGVHDYISRSAGAERLWATLEAALSGRKPPLRAMNQRVPDIKSSREQPIAVQPSMRAILELAKRVASSRSNILIQGESGTGKEVVAHYIHNNSYRCTAPFIAVNCAALPENLLESELFGHERGAFTGAITKKKGKFELAHGGTLLLDEISEMAVSIQAKLLRVLQEREIDRLGGQTTIPVDVRVIATTNRDLKEEIQKGHFRSDLFYRLNVIPLSLPPLRKRGEDLMPLARFFLEKHSRLNQVKLKTLPKEVEEFLRKKEWPGNVRELENLMERATLLVEGETLRVKDLEEICLPEEKDEALAAAGEDDAAGTLRDMEKKMIFQTLQDHNGNRTHAARILGISVRTLRNKLHEYQIAEQD
ncbi:MAG: sigma-54-dependent Fis family transcriptional regulator [Desulfobacteraceae bacterium]|nr:MAG: sigma-54-dependent Fis family transcriptional regulator [Desulfobacteraceae bacterium]